MDTNKTVPPALTSDEWTRVLGNRAIDPGLQRPFDPTDVGADGRPLAAIVGAFRHVADVQWRPEALMALANAMLPDGDPRKITHVMVADLRLAADNADHTAGLFAEDADQLGNRHHAPAHRAHAARLRAHADALAALLPPEGT